MIVTAGGKNVYPEDVEIAFNGISDCLEHAVFAANYVWPTGKLTGEQLMVVLRPKDTSSAPHIVETIRERNLRLSDYKRLSGYILWEKEFPRTASMKLKRDLLAKELRETLRREDGWKDL